MDIRNKRPPETVLSPIAPARELVLAWLDQLGKKTTMVINGKVLKIQHNVPVRGSESRDVSKLTRIYRDHVGRLTCEPVGKESVGYIIWGGTNGRNCHVGLFP